jgi:peptidoglycan/LPS O-acetylase OafA/YrhL
LHALVFLPVYPFQKSSAFRVIHPQLVPMQLGAAGVTFFFVLSGFIIYWSFRPGSSVIHYYWRRILKIYPTHLLAAALFVLAAQPPLSRFVIWLPNVLLVHTWLPQWTMLGGLNVPAWSLCAEILFYLLFPLTLPLIQRIRADRLLFAAGTLTVSIALLHTAYFLWVPGPKGIENTFAARIVPGEVSPMFELHASPAWFAQRAIAVSPSFWLSYSFPLSRLPEFFLGVIAARMVLEGRWRNHQLLPPLASLLLAYAATWGVPVNFKMSVLLVAPMAATIATLAARDMHGKAGLNATQPLVWLGNISFAFYMVQFPVMVLITRWCIGGRSFGFVGWLVWAALSFVASLALGDAVHRFLDAPLMRRFSKRHVGESPPGALVHNVDEPSTAT